MADATAETPPEPKKRSFFKRSAWQDAPKTEDRDMFSHRNEFKGIVAEEQRRRAEERQAQQKELNDRKRKHSEQRERKRQRVSVDNDEATPPKSGSGSSAGVDRATHKARSRTPLSPIGSPIRSPLRPDSLTARYDSLTKSASSASNSFSRKESVIVDLGSDDDDDNGKVLNGNPILDYHAWDYNRTQNIPVRARQTAVADEDDEFEEDLDPELAVLKAKARERAAQRAQVAATPLPDGEPPKILTAQLFISSRIPNASPLLVKVRIDGNTEKPRQAWCAKQGFSPDMTKNVFFTWKGSRIYDSTTIKRFGIQIDQHGNVSVDGDTDIYDEDYIPKVHIEAWTEEIFGQWKQEEAVEAAAKKRAAEAPSVEERDLPLEPVPTVTIRLFLKAKGEKECRLQVKPDTTFGHIAHAYKTSLKISTDQPITLIFDGDRLKPIDTISDTDIEDMDSIDVLFK